jgi:hypothetical protein
MALEGGERSASPPCRSLPLGKTRYPFYRRLGELQGRSGQVRKISPPLGFDSSRYTVYATRPTNVRKTFTKSRLQIREGFCGFMDFLGVFQNFSFRKEITRSFCATSMQNLLLLLFQLFSASFVIGLCLFMLSL